MRQDERFQTLCHEHVRAVVAENWISNPGDGYKEVLGCAGVLDERVRALTIGGNMAGEIGALALFIGIPILAWYLFRGLIRTIARAAREAVQDS